MARSHDIGLDDVVIRCGPFGTVAGLGLARWQRSPVALACADCDDERIVPWSSDGPESVASIHTQAAIVAGRNHDYDSVLPRCFHCLAKRIESIADRYSAAEREVDDANVVDVLKGNSLLNGRDHVAVATCAVRIERAKVDQRRCRRNSLVVSARE